MKIAEAILTVPKKTYQETKSLQATIGEIEYFDFHLMQQTRHYQKFVAGEYVTVFDKVKEGGAINDLGNYCLYPLIDFFGDKFKFTINKKIIRLGSDHTSNLCIKYEKFVGNVNVSKIVKNPNPSIISGTLGTISINTISQFTKVEFNYFSDETPDITLVDNSKNLMDDELENYIKMLNGENYLDFSDLTKKCGNILDTLRKE